MIDIKRLIRIIICSSLFICFTTLIGLQQREAHQIIFVNLGFCLLALLFDNYLLTLFTWWTVFLFIFFKCSIGWGYVIAIVVGGVYYALTKIAFEKKHIEMFLNALLWVGFANICYGIIQVCGYDFVFKALEHLTRSRPDSLVIQAPYGFMGNTGIAAYFYATIGCILASRPYKYSVLLGSIMFIPVFFLHASTSFVAMSACFLFILFYRIKRRYWISLVAILAIICSLFIWKIDPIGKERFDQWKNAMSDVMIHPVTGWGLDSFRNTAPHKPFIYAKAGNKVDNVQTAHHWDNPHNLYISLLFEFGIVGLILFSIYVIRMAKVFINSTKTYENVALTSSILLLLIVSIGQFPIFMGRCAVFIIPMFALFEVQNA